MWIIEHFITPVYDEWLPMALGTQDLALPFYKLDKFNHPHWLPRGWNWVDPQKEVTSNILAIKNGLKTITDIANEQGRDIEDLFAQLAREKELAEQYGLNLPSLFGDPAKQALPAGSDQKLLEYYEVALLSLIGDNNGEKNSTEGIQESIPRLTT